MTLAAEKEYAHIGETAGCRDHDHDVIHELSRRLDALWRFDQYIANAEAKPELEKFWREMKSQESESIRRLKEIVKQEVQTDCF
jgi:protoheme ferro-lyase